MVMTRDVCSRTIGLANIRTIDTEPGALNLQVMEVSSKGNSG